MINAGDETLGIPAYNGGLFDSERNPNLLKWQIGDLYLADAIDLLSRSDVGNGGRRLGFVDYSSLDIRHLGSIYEGLLEYRLRVAETDMVATGGKKKEWAGLEDFNSSRKRKKNFSDFDLFDRVKKDELYLSTDKGERKSTGSYYTPDYIVNYIVKNTIDPVVDERWQKAKERNESLIDATLSVKVLDPAMGSGHFLVGALEHISARLMEAVRVEAESGRIPDDAKDRYTLEWAKREVAAHCIYGVDLNYLAVELAKVSLWLKTIAIDKPLSFLDHRLKCGNSLIGAKLVDLKEYPSSGGRSKKKKAEGQSTLPSFVSRLFIDHLIGKIGELERISDDSLSDIKRKEQVFEEFRQLPEYRKAKAIADVHTAVYFGNEVGATANKKSEDVYHDIVWAIKGDEAEWQRKTNRVWFREAQRVSEDKSFFHWELEFPDVFFEDGGVKGNPGWDCVIGNPPYVRMQGRDEDDKNYLTETYESPKGNYDLYIPFVEMSIQVLSNNGVFCFIMPNKFINVDYGEGLREISVRERMVRFIVNFGDNQIFAPQTTYTCLYFLSRSQEEFRYYEVQNLENVDVELPEILKDLDVHHKVDYIDVKICELSAKLWHFFVGSTGKLLQRIDKMPTKFEDIIDRDFQGVPTGDDSVFILQKSRTGLENTLVLYSKSLSQEIELEHEILRPLFKGAEIQRYYIAENIFYLIFPYEVTNGEMKLISKERMIQRFPSGWNYLKQNEKRLRGRENGRFDRAEWYGYSRPQNLDQFERPKILTQVLSKEPSFSYDFEGKYFFVGGGTAGGHGMTLKSSCHLNYLYVLSLLNSRLLDVFFDKIGTRFRGGYRAYTQGFTGKLPIRRINFTTPPEERTALVESLKFRYNANEFDKIIQLVEECLPKDTEGNFVTEKEKSDVVHDLLAFLAERMIEMNKEKNEEIKGFLEWFEREIGAKIETLTNRTKLKQYHDLDFGELLDILKKNKKKIPANLSNRELQGNLKEEFEGSMRKLKPLIERIERTDRLIDQVVYKLYGLSEEEVRVVGR